MPSQKPPTRTRTKRNGADEPGSPTPVGAAVRAHLIFLPDAPSPHFFVWGPACDGSGAAATATATAGAGGSAPRLVADLCALGVRRSALLIDDTLKPTRKHGVAIALLDALPVLAAVPRAIVERVPASFGAWSLAAKLALELASRERMIPRVLQEDGSTRARFTMALGAQEDADRVAALARAFPLAAHAVPVAPAVPVAAVVPVTPAARAPRTPRTTRAMRATAAARAAGLADAEVWRADALLRRFLDAVADALVRAAAAPAAAAPTNARRTLRPRKDAGHHAPWERRFAAALTGPDPAFEPDGFRERTLLSGLDAWVRPALGVEPGTPRACFRLELPEGQPKAGGDRFPLRFLLQAADDPSLLIPAVEVFGSAAGARLGRIGRSFAAPVAPEELLLGALAMAARMFAPIERGLRTARPDAVLLQPDEAWAFLDSAATALSEAGMGVILPAQLTQSGQRRLRLRMRLGAAGTRRSRSAGAAPGDGGLSLDQLTAFEWEAALAGEALSERELHELARLKAPLVRFRGQWVAVDPREIREARRLLAAGGGTMATAEALAAALEGSTHLRELGVPVDVVAHGRFSEVIERLRAGAAGSPVDADPRARKSPVAGAMIAAPREFRGTLRPYQLRGLEWLAQMSQLGLGACLADDMGLGKTIQLLAFLLHRRAATPRVRGARVRTEASRPTLLVCPTSVLGNWEREIARFAPSLPIVRHYGPERARTSDQLATAPPGAVVLTTYGLLRRDAELLHSVDWSVAALDEAQNIKNASSRGALAARSLRAGFRVALTGTPVENRLAELWSISEFLNPRLLGPLEAFRRDVAVPIERFGRDDVAQRLRRVVRPFLLRRLKSDPTIVRDLPPKNEMKVICTLTREQASLYQATVDGAMERIENAEGIQRRGQVLALITALKQICNHPAQFLGESGPLPRRSGKLDRIGEMLEEALDAGDRALVFTQFREMGDRLVAQLSRTLDTEVLFLHGGVARAARDAMVQRFQEDPRGPRVFVLSVKAGGTGLNLTAASHVFHFDRWWNPAVEDQATDRAHRIGQKRAVQVHKLLCAGTVEEKVDQMLERKRDLASRIVGAGEQWITEMDDQALRELFALAPDAVVTADDADDAALSVPATSGSRVRRRKEARS